MTLFEAAFGLGAIATGISGLLIAVKTGQTPLVAVAASFLGLLAPYSILLLVFTS